MSDDCTTGQLRRRIEREIACLRADLDAARKEVGRLTKALVLSTNNHSARCDERDAAREQYRLAHIDAVNESADNARLREALLKYGRHVGCAKSHRGKYRKLADIPASDKPCTCGLDTALAGPGGE